MSNESPDRSGAPPADVPPADVPPADVVVTLRAELEHALSNLVRLEEEYAELLADPGVIQEDRDATRRLLEGARFTAAAAERAIARFEDGTYGRCARCGGQIAPERLEAIPDAETCVSCSR